MGCACACARAWLIGHGLTGVPRIQVHDSATEESGVCACVARECLRVSVSSAGKYLRRCAAPGEEAAGARPRAGSLTRSTGGRRGSNARDLSRPSFMACTCLGWRHLVTRGQVAARGPGESLVRVARLLLERCGSRSPRSWTRARLRKCGSPRQSSCTMRKGVCRRHDHTELVAQGALSCG